MKEVTPESGSSVSKRKRRPWLRAAVVIGILVLGWTVFERFILDIDRYRSLIAEKIEEAIGLPASIGQLDLVLFPTPHLNAFDVVIGDGDFKVEITRGSIHGNLPAIMRRKFLLHSIELEGLTLTLPAKAEDLQERINRMKDTGGEKEGGGSSSFEIAIEEIFTKDARVIFGQDAPEWARISASVSDVLSDVITIALSSELPSWGEAALLRADLTIKRDPKSGTVNSIKGTGRLAGVELDQALPYEKAPEAVLHADFTVDGETAGRIGFDLDGGLESDAAKALAGTFGAKAWWTDGTFIVNGLHWKAPGVEISADITRDEDGSYAISVPTARVTDEALNDLLAMAELGEFRLAAQRQAAVEGKDLLIGVDPEGVVRLAKGGLSARGIDVTTVQGESVTRGAHCTLEIEEDVVYVRALAGEGFTFSGTITPDFGAESVALDLHGEAVITRARLALFADVESLVEARGKVTVSRFSGTFKGGEGLPEDLVVEGNLSDGRFVVADGALKATLDPVSAEFKTDRESIQSEFRASSEELGPMRINGRYTFEDRIWKGRAMAHLDRIALAFVESQEDKDALAPALAEYGESTLWLTVQMPQAPEPGGLVIEAKRQGTPPAEAVVYFDSGEDGLVLGKITAGTRLSSAKIVEALGAAFKGEGECSITFQRDPSRNRFEAVIDLTDSSIKAGTRFEKRGGDELTISIRGEASDEKWEAQQITIACLGQDFSLDVEEGRFHGRNISVDVARLSRLLPSGSEAHGSLTLTLATGPVEGAVAFQNTGFSMEGAVIESMTGKVLFSENQVDCRNLRVLGDRSDFVLAFHLADERWKGSLTGDAFDANAFTPWLDVFNEVSSTSEMDGDAEETEWDPGHGTFLIDLGKVYYLRGWVEDVYANITASAGGLQAENISVRPYHGKATGSIHLLRATDDKQQLKLDIVLEGVDARVFDDMLFDSTRMVNGIVTGEVFLEMPWGTVEEAMAGGNGVISWTASDGSFGKLGIATKLLSVLKAAEIINLRMPKLRDQGLTYIECSGKLTLEDGVMRLHDTELTSIAYAMEAGGVFDFASDRTDAVVFFRFLQTVTRIVEKIPLLRDAVDETTRSVGVHVKIAGSPFDPEFSVAKADTIIGVPIKVGETLVKGVAETTIGVFKKIFRVDKEEEQ